MRSEPLDELPENCISKNKGDLYAYVSLLKNIYTIQEIFRKWGWLYKPPIVSVKNPGGVFFDPTKKVYCFSARTVYGFSWFCLYLEEKSTTNHNGPKMRFNT